MIFSAQVECASTVSGALGTAGDLRDTKISRTEPSARAAYPSFGFFLSVTVTQVHSAALCGRTIKVSCRNSTTKNAAGTSPDGVNEADDPGFFDAVSAFLFRFERNDSTFNPPAFDHVPLTKRARYATATVNSMISAMVSPWESGASDR